MPLRLVIHAPTEAALTRARANARNLLALEPDAEVEIVVNGPGARAAVDCADLATDALLWLCQNSLEKQGLEARTGVAGTLSAVVQHIARRQAEGWGYMRA